MLDTSMLETEKRPPSEWNATARPFPEHLLIHELFERQVLAQPNAIAVEVASQHLSYRELNERANRLAQLLSRRGYKHGHKIGVCLHRSTDLITALLAVVKVGAAYVPLDPRSPAERLRWMCADAEASAVITEADYAHRFADPQRHGSNSIDCMIFGELQRELLEQPANGVARNSVSGDTGYVMYTSGSTGRPKGVVMSHRAVINTLDWVNRTFSVTAGDRLLFVTPASFDLSVYDIFGTLGAGATLVIATEKQLENPDEIAKLLTERRITLWNSAPSALQMVLPFLESEPPPQSLRLVLLSGDFIPLNLARDVRRLLPQAQFIGLGGATEAAIWSNWHPVTEVTPTWVSVPYGRPIQNCRYYVLDEQQQPVAVGCVGELYIGGVCLATGYARDPALTLDRFVPDPFSEEVGARLYRSGDAVRYCEDGTLEILGRTDSQVKIRGYRVSLTEVEAALSEIAGVRQAVCRVWTDESGHQALTGYLLPYAGVSVNEAEAKHALSEKLPAYMVPARIVSLDSLPVSPNGKLDRKALPTPWSAEAGRERTSQLSETEQRLVVLWERLLGRRGIGVKDNFFDLGGHSLLGVNLILALNEAFDASLSPGVLVECPTVALLAQRVERKRTDGGSKNPWNSVVALRTTGSRAPLFFAPGLGGSVLELRNLASELGEDQPFYGLQYQGLEDGQQPHDSIVEMAAEMIRHMQSVQRVGPYFVGGYSAGGVVAFEIAYQLKAKGHEVGLLVLLDAFNPTLPRRTSLERLNSLIARARRYGAGYVLTRARKRGTAIIERLRRSWAALKPAAPSRQDTFETYFSAALCRYNPPRYSGYVLLIRSDASRYPDVGYQPDELNGWGKLIDSGPTVRRLDGSHSDLLNRNAWLVASATADVLKKVT